MVALLEPDAALEELRTLYDANRLPDGLLSHQRYVPGAEEHQHFIESLSDRCSTGIARRS